MPALRSFSEEAVDIQKNSLNLLADYIWRWLPWVAALQNDNV